MLIIDTHTHAGRNWFEPIEVLEFQMDRNGVDRAVLIQHGGTFDNGYLFEEAGKRGDRFKVVVLVDPESDDPLGDLSQVGGAGAAGVRFAPDEEFVNAGPFDMWQPSRVEVSWSGQGSWGWLFLVRAIRLGLRRRPLLG